MRITNIETQVVAVPFKAPVRWAFGVRTGTTRTIVKVFTDEGIVGLGETYGGRSTVTGINGVKPLLLGEDPFNIELLLRKLMGSTGGHLPVGKPLYFSALEMACWDIIGKALNTPVYNLIGGMSREKIPFDAIVYYRYEGEGGFGGESTSEDIVRHISDLMDKYGIKAFKFKTGVFDPNTELKIIRQIREDLGYDIAIRIDPNAVWSIGTSIKVIREAEKYDLEFVEDPTWNLDGMAKVREKVHVPLATNMCVVSFDQIAPAIEMGAIDIIHSDVMQWGGIWNSKKLAAITEAFQLGLGLHDNASLGISIAASLHFAAATPYLTYACDQHYNHYVGDVIAEPFKIKDGCMKVPDRPGLGVELNQENVEKYNKLYKEEGEARHTFDPKRPNWIPIQPSW